MIEEEDHDHEEIAMIEEEDHDHEEINTKKKNRTRRSHKIIRDLHKNSVLIPYYKRENKRGILPFH